MLVFIDESEWPRPKDPRGFTVWGAVAIHPSRSKDFFRDVFQLERKFWKVEEPYAFEIKGRLLLSKRAATKSKNREFCEELVNLCKSNNVKAFAYGLRNHDPASFSEERTRPVIYRAYSRLLEGVNAMMVEDYPEDMAIVALDSQDQGTDTARARTFGDFLYGSSQGRQLTHIVETPFFVSSMATLGIQLADVVAYVLAQPSLGRTDINDIDARIRELEWQSRSREEGPWRGFRFEDLKQWEA